MSTEEVTERERIRNSIIKHAFTKQQRVDHTLQEEHDRRVLRSAADRRTITRALINLITRRNLPHSIVEWPEFHALVAAINPEAKVVASYTTMSRRIHSMFIHYKLSIKRQLRLSLSKKHLSTDS